MRALTAILNAPATVRRGIAFSISAILVTIVVGLVFVTLASLAKDAAEIEAKRERLGQMQAVIALASSAKTTPDLADEGRVEEFLHGESEAVIRSGLQTRLNAIATARGVAVLSASNAAALVENGISYVGLRVDLSGKLEAVHNLIFDLESAHPVLFIRGATLRSADPATISNQTAEPDLFAEILFYGALPPGMALAEAKP